MSLDVFCMVHVGAFWKMELSGGNGGKAKRSSKQNKTKQPPPLHHPPDTTKPDAVGVV